MNGAPESLTARDVMTTRLVTLRPDMTLVEAVEVLVHAGVSGAPVVDEAGALLGLVSEYDCLRIMAAAEYTSEDHEQRVRVETIMSAEPFTIGPDLELFGIAAKFTQHGVRRFPVVEDGALVGQVSRMDVLRGVWKLREARVRKESPPTQAPERTRGLYLSATERSPGPLGTRMERGRRQGPDREPGGGSGGRGSAG